MTGGEPYPRRFGRYVLVDKLARGGMGELHLAVLGSGDGIQKLCVIKQILGYLSDPEYIQRFLDEVRIMAKLSHGNLVQVLESGRVNGQYFLAMEFVEGRNLRELWNSLRDARAELPLNLALYIVKELCRGLAFAHSTPQLELVHRDVSPPNVLLSFAGEVRLVDFGLALSSLKVQKTAPGVLLGKLAYMSPEQARGEPLDARSDIFAAGVILWELITGQRRFPRELSQSEQLNLAMGPKLVLPSKLRRDLPPQLDHVIEKALAPDRDNRFADAELMRSEIATILAGVDPTTDASELQRFLAWHYGDTIEAEREERQLLLQEMGEQIEGLLATPTASGGLGEAIEQLESGLRPPELASAELEPGSRLADEYLIHEAIGEGSMGKVYRATHLGTDREAALKILLPEYANIPSVKDRFQMEARAAKRVGHRNVLEILEAGTTDAGPVYYAMELLAGTSLADLMHDERALATNQALRIGVQLCAALSAAHRVGVIHRDLKPENIYLVARDGELDFVKVMGFGLARIEGAKSNTLPGLAVGTPDYMAPEQARSLPVDARADIYSLGVVLYEMLAGDVPRHTGSSGMPRDGEVVPGLRERRRDVSPALEQLILSALELDPARRPATMDDLHRELCRELDGGPAEDVSLRALTRDPLAELTTAPGARGPEAANATALVPVIDPAPRPLGRWLPAAMTATAAVLAAIAALVALRGPPDAKAPDAATATAIAAPDARILPRDTDAAVREPPRVSEPSKPPRPPRRGTTGPLPPRRPQRKSIRLEGTLDPFEK